MRPTIQLLTICAVLSTVGCTSRSWTQISRNYLVTYDEVFRVVPVECKKVQMSLKKANPEAGLIVLNSHRVVDKLLTASVFNLVLGDEVIVKVQRVEPTVTNVWIDSKARGQIGPDLGRTDRNVKALAKVLDAVWAQSDTAEERGERRTPPGEPSGTR